MSEKEIIAELREEVKELKKRVKDLEFYHQVIGPGPLGYPHEREAAKKQAKKEADEMIEGIPAREAVKRLKTRKEQLKDYEGGE